MFSLTHSKLEEVGIGKCLWILYIFVYFIFSWCKCFFQFLQKMNQGASVSSSQKSDCEGSKSEDLERSFDDESFKGEFTNALRHSLFIYKNNNLITENPPQNISSISKTMAEKISVQNRLVALTNYYSHRF